MKNEELKRTVNSVLVCILFLIICGCAQSRTKTENSDGPASLNEDLVTLPSPNKKGKMSLEETLQKRRSKRSFKPRELTMQQISQLLWACQGVTEPAFGGRTAPSAGALYPLEVYMVKRDGEFYYLPAKHRLRQIKTDDVREELAKAALGQEPAAKAPVSFIICGVYERTAAKYGERAERYVKLEAGHACQNLLLQAVALDLGGVPLGAFRDEEIKQVLSLPSDHQPLYVVPVGYPTD